MNKNKKKHYRFNLRELEDHVNETYDEFKKEDTQETRTQLFFRIRDLAFAVLSVGNYAKYSIDFEQTAYEYGLYMFQRLVLGSFHPRAKGRFPWQDYIRKNILHVIFTMRDDLQWQEAVQDVAYLIENDETLNEPDLETPPPDELLHQNSYAEHLFKTLRLYYSIEDIKRLYPLSMDFIFQNPRYFISPDAPEDIRDFSIILVSSAKRIAQVYELTRSQNNTTNPAGLKRALTSSVRSTMFLSTVVNSDFFPKEFLLALDTDSLYRLSSIMGGQTVRVPTLRELDTLIGAVVTVSKIVIDGKKKDEALKEAKGDFELVFSNYVNVQNFVSKVLNSYDLFKEDTETEPIINLLAISIKSIDKLLDKMVKESDKSSSMEVVKQYSELSKSFTKITDSLVNISQLKKGTQNHGQSDHHV